MSRGRLVACAVSVLAALVVFGSSPTAQDYYHKSYFSGTGSSAGPVTMTGALLFSPDNTYDIGANSASRPANVWVANQINALVYALGSGNGGKYAWGNGNAAISNATPTISSGFGTSPSITGSASAFRVTLGTPVGQSGVVLFNLTVAFGSAPLVTCRDETTQTANPPTYTVTSTQVTVTFTTAIAADKVGCTVIGLP